MKEGIIMLTVRLTGSYIAILSIISLSASSLFAASASTPKWEQLVAAGRKEGRVVLIGPTIPNLRQAYTEEFPKDTGIELLYEGLGPALVSPRIEREAAAGNVSADAILGGSVELRTLYPKKLLAPIKPVLAMPEVVDLSKWVDGKIEFTDPEHEYMLRTVSGVYGGMVINTSKVPKSAIKSSKDLLKPEWKGKIVSSPTAAGSGSGFAANVLYRLKAEYFSKLYKGQQVTFIANSRSVVEAIARGSYLIGFGIFPHEVEGFKKEGFPLEVIYADDLPGYLSASNGTVKLVKKGPHPHAGAVFANWFAGKKAQEIMMRTTLDPSRRIDVDRSLVPDYTIPRKGIDYLDQHENEFYTRYRNQVIKQVDELLGR
jgi:ABC-type Fe3+ transport system substrate-binding protein